MDETILFILLPSAHIFGQEKALITLATVLKSRGMKIHFLIHEVWGADISKYLDITGLPWSKLPMGSIWSISLFLKNPLLIWQNISGILKSSYKLYLLLKKNKGAYFLTGNATFTFYILPTLLISKIPVIYRHGDVFASHSLFHRVLNKILLRRIDSHVVNCRYLKKLLKINGLKDDPKIIYNLSTNYQSLHANKIQNISINKNLSAGECINILYIGQLSLNKGLIELFDAFNLIKKNYPSTYLHIAG